MGLRCPESDKPIVWLWRFHVITERGFTSDSLSPVYSHNCWGMIVSMCLSVILSTSNVNSVAVVGPPRQMILIKWTILNRRSNIFWSTCSMRWMLSQTRGLSRRGVWYLGPRYARVCPKASSFFTKVYSLRTCTYVPTSHPDLAINTQHSHDAVSITNCRDININDVIKHDWNRAHSTNTPPWAEPSFGSYPVVHNDTHVPWTLLVSSSLLAARSPAFLLVEECRCHGLFDCRI